MAPLFDINAVAVALGFTLEQLEANRRGELTSDQLMALAPNIVIALLMCAAVVAMVFFSQRLAGAWTLRRGAIVAGVVIGGLGFASWIGLAPVRDLLAGGPTVVEGALGEILTVPYGKGEAPVLTIGGVELQGKGEPTQVRELVVPGTYRAYYLPQTRRLLSLERVE